jgi:translation initiation factor IF-1
MEMIVIASIIIAIAIILYHSITVKLADGTTKEAHIKGSLWETLHEGDRVQKRAGAYVPVKKQKGNSWVHSSQSVIIPKS